MTNTDKARGKAENHWKFTEMVVELSGGKWTKELQHFLYIEVWIHAVKHEREDVNGR